MRAPAQARRRWSSSPNREAAALLIARCGAQEAAHAAATIAAALRLASDGEGAQMRNRIAEAADFSTAWNAAPALRVARFSPDRGDGPPLASAWRSG